MIKTTPLVECGTFYINLKGTLWFVRLGRGLVDEIALCMILFWWKCLYINDTSSKRCQTNFRCTVRTPSHPRGHWGRGLGCHINSPLFCVSNLSQKRNSEKVRIGQKNKMLCISEVTNYVASL